MTRQKIAILASATYLVGAAVLLTTFLMAPPDGLANIWIAIWTFPITFIGIGVLDYTFGIGFPFVPSGGALGYYAAYVVYFVSAVAVLSLLIYRVIRGRS